ncbi:hypothetical protein [uncultured Shewanella sp.]|uniref:hypothetical protein n=1 Tax=uncultured Shewanella sp. TaxID=173975 RepID=UPI0026095FF1|nr:hypothetical protein [uncultured Shewanella sp.]
MKIALMIFTLYVSMLVPSQANTALCKVPTTLTGKRFVLELDGQYTHNNPRAGELQEFIFTPTTLTERSLNTGETLSGEYQYHVLAPDIGMLSTSLMQEEALFSKFELTFMCKNNTTGRYIFSQIAGREPPAIRQNVGTYFMMPD